MPKFLKSLGGTLILVMLAVVVGWLAMRRSDVPYVWLEAKYANAQSRFVDLPEGYHVHYRDQGNPKGQTIVLVHGFFVSLETWEPWVKAVVQEEAAVHSAGDMRAFLSSLETR